MIDRTLLTDIVTLVAVILAFMLGLLADWFRNANKRKELKISVKTLIDLEIEKNKILLKDFWFTVAAHEKYWLYENAKLDYVKLAVVLNDIPLPYMSFLAWQNNFNSLPTIYNKEKLLSLWKLYEQFELLIQMKEHLLFVKNESEYKADRIQLSSSSVSRMVAKFYQSQYFNKDAERLAEQFKITIEFLIGSDLVVFNNKPY